MSTKLAADRAIKQMMREQRNHAFTQSRKKEIDLDLTHILLVCWFIFCFLSFSYSTYKTVIQKPEVRILEGID